MLYKTITLLGIFLLNSTSLFANPDSSFTTRVKKPYISDKHHFLFTSIGSSPYIIGMGYQAVIKGYVGLEIHGSILGGWGIGAKAYPLNLQKGRVDPYLSFTYQDDKFQKWELYTLSTGLDLKLKNHNRWTFDVGVTTNDDLTLITGNLRYSMSMTYVYKGLKKITLADVLNVIIDSAL